VCASLVEAHGIGLIHRDIKPSNIILTRRGGLLDFVKLVDFGLVKAVEPGTAEALTPSDSIVGTPLYMAPEAIRRPEQSDGRSDLYAVAAVGYFLLTGRPVFEGQSIADILFQQVTVDPQPPSAHCEHTVAPDLESLLLGCLAKDPASRPASASAMAEALEHISASVWSASDADAWWRTHVPDSPNAAPSDHLPAPDSPLAMVGADPTFVWPASE
jgi:eukaryotic-like serine/threonine-protein kinase